MDAALSIDRPRRIFRSGNVASRRSRGFGAGLSRTVLAGLLGAVGGGALVMMSLPVSLFGRNTPGPNAVGAAAADVAVIDGDTLRLGGSVVRLSDLVAPNRGQACAAGPDCGRDATAMLANLVRDRDVACTITAHDGQGRPLARCTAGDRDINTALVAAGWARASDATLAAAEQAARARRTGLWRDY